MNQLKTIMYLCQRGYRGSQRVKTPRIRRDLDNKNERKLYPEIKESDIQFDEDYTDPDFNEPDFTLAHKSYNEHMRETYIEKQKLKGRIVAQKLFKSNDPNFITWAEREQIINLHKKDSDEWTPEQLSKSFPALPETIKKLLKSKWIPKSAESVIQYDEKVVKNWDQFKAGQLNLDPRLAKHLEKFKGRKIEVADLKQIAEKFVRPPRVFPTPKSKIFTSIVQSHIENTKGKDGDNQPLKIEDGKNKVNKKDIVNMTLFLSSSDRVKNQGDYKTYDSFLEENVKKVAGKENLDLEDKLLINEYKEQKNSVPVLSHSNMEVSAENDESSGEISNASAEVKVTTIPVPKFDESSLETGILEWKKKESGTQDNYPRFIKVPQAKAKSGVTFKVKDCYYDCDGEFLYRVPGLRS